MENIDLALINGYHEYPLSDNFYKRILINGKTGLVITPNGYEYKKLLKKGVNVLFLNDYFPLKTPSLDTIKEYFKNKGVHDLADFIMTEKAYYNSSEKSLIKYAYNYSYAFDRIFTEFKIRKIFQLQGGEVIRRAASLIAKEKGVERVYSGESFIKGLSTLFSDEFKTLILPSAGKEILNKKEIQDIIEGKLSQKRVSTYDPFIKRTRDSKLRKFLNLAWLGNYNIIKSYFYHKYKTSIKHHFIELLSKRYFQQFEPEKSYFYYPFNVAAESELFIRNKQHYDQLQTVLEISKHLPSNYLLYVKTHPGNEGHLRLKEYHDLNKLENVKLIRSTINSFDVVNNSEGVIIVSSTVGLESYISGKPTCVIGNWPYLPFGNFIAEKDLKLISKKIIEHSTNEPENLIQNIYKISHRGNLFGGKDDFEKMVDSILNV